jgi:hypothetical protein
MAEEIPTEYVGEVNLEYYRANTGLTRDFGPLAIKTLMTLNSGAFIVLLTFIGNTAAQSQFTIPLNNLKYSLFFFLAGLCLTAIAIAVPYIHSQKATPYPAHAEQLSNTGLLLLMMVFPTLAFGAFIAGVVLSVNGIVAAP